MVKAGIIEGTLPTTGQGDEDIVGAVAIPVEIENGGGDDDGDVGEQSNDLHERKQKSTRSTSKTNTKKNSKKKKSTEKVNDNKEDNTEKASETLDVFFAYPVSMVAADNADEHRVNEESIRVDIETFIASTFKRSGQESGNAANVISSTSTLTNNDAYDIAGGDNNSGGDETDVPSYDENDAHANDVETGKMKRSFNIGNAADAATSVDPKVLQYRNNPHSTNAHLQPIVYNIDDGYDVCENYRRNCCVCTIIVAILILVLTS